MRKLLRSMARANMKRAGIRKMNKMRYTYDARIGKFIPVGSYFSENWRKWIDA